MAWSEKSKFRAAELPARWHYRMKRLKLATENVELYFRKTLLVAGPENKADITEDIENFLELFSNHVTPFAQRWFQPPLVFYALADPISENASAVALAMWQARRGQRDVSTDTSFTYRIVDLRGISHPLLDSEELWNGVCDVIAGPPGGVLLIYLENVVLCLQHNNLGIESSFNHLGEINNGGKRRRSAGKEVVLHKHLMNTSLNFRVQVASARRWKPTKDNLVALQDEILNYIDRLRTVEEKDLQKLEIHSADYMVSFQQASVTARPGARTQIKPLLEAARIVVPRPYKGIMESKVLPAAPSVSSNQENSAEEKSESEDESCDDMDFMTDSGDEFDAQADSGVQSDLGSSSDSDIDENIVQHLQADASLDVKELRRRRKAARVALGLGDDRGLDFEDLKRRVEAARKRLGTMTAKEQAALVQELSPYVNTNLAQITQSYKIVGKYMRDITEEAVDQQYVAVQFSSGWSVGKVWIVHGLQQLPKKSRRQKRVEKAPKVEIMFGDGENWPFLCRPGTYIPLCDISDINSLEESPRESWLILQPNN